MNLPGTKKLNQNQILAINAALFILLSSSMVYFIIIMNINKIKNLKAEIITHKINLENKIDREKNMPALLQKIEQIEPKMDILSGIFINENRELEFITTLEGVANNNNVEQKLNLDFKNNLAGGKNYKKVPLTINSQGTYENLMNYLKDLEKLDYYINIEKLDILGVASARGGIKDSGEQRIQNYNLSINCYTYWK